MTKAQQLLRFLRFLRITDENNNLSLTNIAVVVTISVLLTRPDVNIAQLGTFLAAMVGYNVKRFATTLGDPADQGDMDSLREAVAKLESKTTALQLQNSLTRRS